ncbi:MAG: Holliday junction resolvase RuvX [Cryomorphaceae bacterium]|nr:Holliday junction resolvase RuvX [Cryomorphaceae bacterium]
MTKIQPMTTFVSMGIWLGLDVGGKRTGIAESDENGLLAFPKETILTSEILTYLKSNYEISFLNGIIIGNPKRLDGGETHGTQHAKAVFEKISNLWPSVEIHWVDERFTSKIAAQAAHLSGAKSRIKKNKSMLDSASACIILDSFLTQKKIK